MVRLPFTSRRRCVGKILAKPGEETTGAGGAAWDRKARGAKTRAWFKLTRGREGQYWASGRVSSSAGGRVETQAGRQAGKRASESPPHAYMCRSRRPQTPARTRRAVSHNAALRVGPTTKPVGTRRHVNPKFFWPLAHKPLSVMQAAVGVLKFRGLVRTTQWAHHQTYWVKAPWQS